MVSAVQTVELENKNSEPHILQLGALEDFFSVWQQTESKVVLS